MERPKQYVRRPSKNQTGISFDPIDVVKIWALKMLYLRLDKLERQDYDGWRRMAGIKFASSRWLVDRYGSWNTVIDLVCQELGIVNPNTGLATIYPKRVTLNH